MLYPYFQVSDLSKEFWKFIGIGKLRITLFLRDKIKSVWCTNNRRLETDHSLSNCVWRQRPTQHQTFRAFWIRVLSNVTRRYTYDSARWYSWTIGENCGDRPTQSCRSVRHDELWNSALGFQSDIALWGHVIQFFQNPLLVRIAMFLRWLNDRWNTE